MRRRTMSGWIVAATLVPALAWAQGSGHGHVHSGNEVRIGRHEVELAVRGGQATLSILDETEQPVDAAAFGATAIVLARGNERRTLDSGPPEATAWWRRSASRSMAGPRDGHPAWTQRRARDRPLQPRPDALSRAGA